MISRAFRWLVAYLAVRVAFTATLLADWADPVTDKEAEH